MTSAFPIIRPLHNRDTEKVQGLLTGEKLLPTKTLSLSISSPLVRRLGRAKKKRGTGGEDDGAVLSELETNRGSVDRYVRAPHFVL
jgi:hypothetical protein